MKKRHVSDKILTSSEKDALVRNFGKPAFVYDIPELPSSSSSAAKDAESSSQPYHKFPARLPPFPFLVPVFSFPRHALSFYPEEMGITNFRGLRWSSATRPIPAAQYSLAKEQTAPAVADGKPATQVTGALVPLAGEDRAVWIAAARVHVSPSHGTRLV